eukprot:gene11161-14978_t
MGDSWEDEEFEVPILPTTNSINVPNSWEDEVDQVEVDVVIKTQPAASTIEKAAKKALEDERLLALKLEQTKLANETPEEKKARLKREVEEADYKLTGELFGGEKASVATTSNSGVKGIGATIVKTKQDHLNFGSACASKLSESSAFNIAAFYKSLSECLKSSTMTSETIDEVLATINKIREEKLIAEKPVNKGPPKKSKKAINAAVKKHNDVFGGSDFVDKYDEQYGYIEDEFM